MKEEKREKMIKENNLIKYYSELAGKLDEIIPCEWERIALYAEETGDVSAASFFFLRAIPNIIIVRIYGKNGKSLKMGV